MMKTNITIRSAEVATNVRMSRSRSECMPSPSSSMFATISPAMNAPRYPLPPAKSMVK